MTSFKSAESCVNFAEAFKCTLKAESKLIV